LITGRYQQRWGNYWYGEGGLPQKELTIPEVLGSAGYATAKVGKTHLNGGPKEFPTQHGFDEFLGFMNHTWDYIRLSEKDVEAFEDKESFKGFGKSQILGPMTRAVGRGKSEQDAESVSYENGFTTKIFTDEAVKFIEKDRGEKPFYLQVAHNAVHMPTYVVEEQWAKRVGARYIPWNRDAKNWDYPYWDPDKETYQVFHKRWGHMGAVDREGRRCYLANLLALDDGISRILDALEATGQRGNTLVVFVSDNGGTINTYANNTPLNGWKYMFGEGGIRVPMLVSMPGALPQNQINDSAIVSTMDIFPTVAEIAGVTSPANLDGRSLVPVLKGEREKNHSFIAWAKSRDEWVIRKGKWKLTNKVGWTHADFDQLSNGDVVPAKEEYVYSGEPQLFDLENDIGETTNLISKYPDVAEELRRTYAEWDAQLPGPMTSTGKPKKRKK